MQAVAEATEAAGVDGVVAADYEPDAVGVVTETAGSPASGDQLVFHED